MAKKKALTQDPFMKHYEKLIGKTVVGIEMEEGGLDGRDIYDLVFNDGTKAAILQDPEGNGPGHLDIF